MSAGGGLEEVLDEISRASAPTELTSEPAESRALGLTSVPVVFGYASSLRFIGTDELHLGHIHVIASGGVRVLAADAEQLAHHQARLVQTDVSEVGYTSIGEMFKSGDLPADESWGVQVYDITLLQGQMLYLPPGMLIARKPVQGTADDSKSVSLASSCDVRYDVLWIPQQLLNRAQWPGNNNSH